MPRIAAVGVAIPEKWPQERVFKAMGYRELFRPVFEGAGIAERPFCIAPEQVVATDSQDVHINYRASALELTRLSTARCLTKAKVAPQEVDVWYYVSCTGFEVPAINCWLLGDMGFRKETEWVPVAGMGCQGALPGLREAANHIAANPGHKACVSACEISNAAYFPDDRKDPNMARANAIFGDGSATALVTGEGPGLEMVDYITVTDNAYIDDIKMPWERARLKLVLTGRVADVTSDMVRDVAGRLLERNGLKKEGIAHWVVHSGGVSILDKVEKKVGLSREALRWSWDTWREVGNLSSPTILIALGKLLDSGELREGDWVLMVGLGAGLQAVGMLLRWTLSLPSW